MVSFQEKLARLQAFFRFSGSELGFILVAAIVTGFIFSFRDWGMEQFDLSLGLTHALLATLAALILFIFRFSCQKVYGLWEGYTVTAKPWWMGLLLALILSFITTGFIPLVVIGNVAVSFMTRQRMGEFRYGFSYWNNAIISMWAVYASIIGAILFSLLLQLFPQSYFLDKGVLIALVMGACSLLPIPQLEALQIYQGAPWLYFLAWAILALSAVLLLTRSTIGLSVMVVSAVVFGVGYWLIGSEK